jgi:hypothetical protein
VLSVILSLPNSQPESLTTWAGLFGRDLDLADSITESEEDSMKGNVASHLISWVRSLYAGIGPAASSSATLRSPAAFLPALLPEAKRFPPEPANSQPKPLFSQWFDTWRTRNEGVRQ